VLGHRCINEIQAEKAQGPALNCLAMSCRALLGPWSFHIGTQSNQLYLGDPKSLSKFPLATKVELSSSTSIKMADPNKARDKLSLWSKIRRVFPKHIPSCRSKGKSWCKAKFKSLCRQRKHGGRSVEEVIITPERISCHADILHELCCTDISTDGAREPQATNFSDLPTELRLMIWGYLTGIVYEAHIMHMVVGRKNVVRDGRLFDPIFRLLLHTCVESRELVHKHSRSLLSNQTLTPFTFERLEPLNFAISNYLFIPNLDTLYLECSGLTSKYLDLYHDPGFEMIDTLAIDGSLTAIIPTLYRVCRIQSLRELLVIISQRESFDKVTHALSRDFQMEIKRPDTTIFLWGRKEWAHWGGRTKYDYEEQEEGWRVGLAFEERMMERQKRMRLRRWRHIAH
jgi:hypothetical protein